MNVKQRREWLDGLGDCFPELRLEPLRRALERLDALKIAGRWEAGVRGAGVESVAVRFFGEGPAPDWARGAAAVFAAPDPGNLPPPAAGPWLACDWDLTSGAWSSLRLYGRDARPRRSAVRLYRPGAAARSFAREIGPFNAKFIGEPALQRPLEQFARLAPVGAVAREQERWALLVAEGFTWPDFLRCDIAGAFAPTSAQQSLFLLDRQVRELEFDGEALWAFIAG